MSDVERRVEELEESVRNLTKLVEQLTWALIQAGICPGCGGKLDSIETYSQGIKGIKYLCTKCRFTAYQT